MEMNTARRRFLTTCALAGVAAAQPLAAFGQAVEKTGQASAPSALRITDLKCGYIRGSLFVKIHTNQGIWGCGEAVDKRPICTFEVILLHLMSAAGRISDSGRSVFRQRRGAARVRAPGIPRGDACQS
jgi:galactonate dehydratase